MDLWDCRIRSLNQAQHVGFSAVRKEEGIDVDNTSQPYPLDG